MIGKAYSVADKAIILSSSYMCADTLTVPIKMH